MKQNRLKAYLSLIQELLTCPSGEEWIRLRQHEDLVDADLVQTMEQVAATLAHDGNGQGAKFLHSWAGQLHHILAKPDPTAPTPEDRTQRYIDFIQALLQASPQEKQDLIAANQPLITPGLVQMMRQISAQLMAQGDLNTASYLKKLATELSKLWLSHHGFHPEPQVPSGEPEPPRPPFKPPIPKDFQSAPPAQGKPDPQKKPTPVAKTPAPAPSQPKAQPPDEPVVPDPWSTPAPEPGAAPRTANPQVPAADAPILQSIESHLATIATALTTLNEQLSQQKALQNPLWHLDALEQAQQQGWILTTDEVERLIQVKPKCAGQATTFQRGCWRFVKSGKIGTQTAWRIEKVTAVQA